SILIVLLLKLRSSPKYTLFPYTTLFRSVRAAADVLELVPRAPVHAEVEEDEVRPGVDRVVEDVDALVRRDARGAKVDVGIDPHREDRVVGADVIGDVDAEVGQETVHHRGVPDLVLYDLGDDVLLLHARGPHDPRDVP